MNKPAFSLPALVLLLSALALSAEEKMVIRQHWEPGKVYHLETNMDMEMNMPGALGGGTQNTTLIQHMEAVVRKEAGSDRRLVETKYVAIKAMIDAGGKLVTYDSADPAMSQPELQQAFGALLGKSITLVYDKDDKFVDVIVPDDFIPTPLGEGKGPDGKQFANMIRESVDFGLPAETLAVGGSFALEKKLDMMPLGSVTTKMKGRLDSIVQHEGRKHAKIVMEGTMDMPELPADAAGQVKMLPGNKVSAETLFDLERKRSTLSTVRNDMKMSVGGMEMTMKQTIVSKLKSVEDAPAETKK